MALIVTGSKDIINVTSAYLLAVSIDMSRYLRPTDTGIVPAVQYEAQVHIYKNRQERLDKFMSTPVVETVKFTHVNGHDALSELYTKIKTEGIAGWTFSSVQDDV